MSVWGAGRGSRFFWGGGLGLVLKGGGAVGARYGALAGPQGALAASGSSCRDGRRLRGAAVRQRAGPAQSELSWRPGTAAPGTT